MLHLHQLWGATALVSACCLSALLAGCPKQGAGVQTADRPAAETSEAGALPVYVVTVKPLEMILSRIVGDRGTVQTLLKAGADAHTYDPVPEDMQTLSQCRAFFWVGEHYDGWAGALESPDSIEVLPLVPAEFVQPMPEHQHGEDAGGEHEGHVHAEGESSAVDPHFFTDPLTVQALLAPLAEALAELDPQNASEFAANAEQFGMQLDELDSRLRQQMQPFAGEKLIMFHPSFNYFIARYGLVYGGAIEPFPGKEPSPRYLQEIVKLIRQQNVKAVFSETLLPSAPAEAIAEAAGVRMVELDPACGDSGRTYSGYEDWLSYNAGLICEALAPPSGQQ